MSTQTPSPLKVLRTWLIALAVLLAAPAWGSRLALVIGNDQYQSVDKLNNAKNDANLMAGVLRKAGFTVSQSNDLGRERLWAAIDSFKNRINKGDEVVFYFAGHGVQIGSTQLLLPTDIKAQSDSQVQRDGIALVDVQDALKDARVAVLIIDACRDNPFPKQGGTRSVGATRGLLPPEPATGQIIMLSAGRNQKALDAVPGKSSKNGLFTWELAQVIQTPGVEIRSALEQVKNSVDDIAKSASHEQRPSLVNDLRGNFYFIAPGAQVIIQNAPAPVTQIQTAAEAEQDLWFSIKDANSVDALNTYLTEFPSGRYVAQAKVLLVKLGAIGSTKPAATTVVVGTTPVVQGPSPGRTIKDCDVCPELVVIPAGSFQMGNKEMDYESPIHPVNIKSFGLGKTEVTQGQWKAVMGSNPSASQACVDNCPVDKVSWEDAQNYIQKLNAISGKRYRLASEAEWEYAARAGSSGKWSFGDDEGQMPNHAWFSMNSGGKSQAVGQKQANAFGLYDMHGNVWEWIEDCHHSNYAGAPGDGSAWTTGCYDNLRVIRGGS